MLVGPERSVGYCLEQAEERWLTCGLHPLLTCRRCWVRGSSWMWQSSCSTGCDSSGWPMSTGAFAAREEALGAPISIG